MHAARITLAVLVTFWAHNVASGQGEAKNVEKRSVTARVVSAVGEGTGIHAKKVPGPEPGKTENRRLRASKVIQNCSRGPDARDCGWS